MFLHSQRFPMKSTGNLVERISEWQKLWKFRTVIISGRYTGLSPLEPYIPKDCKHLSTAPLFFLEKIHLHSEQKFFSSLRREEEQLSSSYLNSETHNSRAALLYANPPFAHSRSALIMLTSWGWGHVKPVLRSPVSKWSTFCWFRKLVVTICIK